MGLAYFTLVILVKKDIAAACFQVSQERPLIPLVHYSGQGPAQVRRENRPVSPILQSFCEFAHLGPKHFIRGRGFISRHKMQAGTFLHVQA